jgi:hypothetical protein
MVCERKQEEFHKQYNISDFDIVDVYEEFTRYDILNDEI